MFPDVLKFSVELMLVGLIVSLEVDMLSLLKNSKLFVVVLHLIRPNTVLLVKVVKFMKG